MTDLYHEAQLYPYHLHAEVRRYRQALEDILARHRHPSGDSVTAEIAARALGGDA